MKKKYNVELPKYRLQLNVRLIKRRKPLVAEPILPTASVVKRKYRKGTFAGRLARYFADHKNIRKVFAGSFAMITIATSLMPQTSNVQAESSNLIIESQTNLTTQKGMQYPVDSIKVNQNYRIFHPGIDFGGTKTDSIKAVANGVVVGTLRVMETWWF
jgi:murein DD-endopeptidase MepM/ murein hydrolase activator NlpD